VLACVAVAGLASFAVVRFVAPRPVGGTVTGAAPDSIAVLLVQARQSQAIDRAGAILLYRKVLDRDPDNAEARTYIGWLVANNFLQQGLAATTAPALVQDAMTASEGQLDRAIALDPTYADPKCFKAVVRFRFFADAAGAKSSVDACLASNPPAVVKGLVQNLQTDVDKALAGG
jgi:Ni,Fe-hydrogenase III large subunit